MYVAAKPLTDARRAGEVLAYEPGDAIPDFETWTIGVRRALLGHGMVVRQANVDEERLAVAVVAEQAAEAVDLPDDRPPDPPGEPLEPDDAKLACALCPEMTFRNAKALGAHKRWRH